MATSTKDADPMSDKPSTAPTILSAARLAAAPVVAGLVLWAHAMTFTAGPERSALIYSIAALVFVAAALTDLVDGWLARKLNAVTPFGAALDHAADKALVAGALVALSYALLPLPLVIAAILLIIRDIAVAGLREALASSGRAPPVGRVGKVKAFAEMAGVTLALVLPAAAYGPRDLLDALSGAAHGLLWAAVALALWSAGVYLRAAISQRT
jgi:CDP-diacylglycerol--glycerol-3-phosphate 3-phosphatidyltransferase